MPTFSSFCRSFLLGRLLAAGLVASMLGTLAPAQQQGDTGASEGRQLDLKDQLTYGLRAFTPGDKLFIDKVVLAVEQGQLPRRLVDSTFLWARQRAEQRSWTRRLRPMVYFQPGLTLRAKRIGVTL